jgi:hypothetical protein
MQTYIRVEICPNFFEPHCHLMVEEARILQLSLIVTTKNDCYEELQENQRDYKHVADEEYKSACSGTTP